jgi:hypothetical protein
MYRVYERRVMRGERERGGGAREGGRELCFVFVLSCKLPITMIKKQNKYVRESRFL